MYLSKGMNASDRKDISDFLSGVTPNVIEDIIMSVANSGGWRPAIDTHDVAQSVRLALLKNFAENRYNGNGLAAYVQTVTKRHCLMDLRKQYREKDYLERFSEIQRVFPPEQSTPESDILLAERQSQGAEAINSLGVQCRRALVLRFVYGEPYKELARRLEMSEVNARVLVHRCLQKCRQTLNDLQSSFKGGRDEK